MADKAAKSNRPKYDLNASSRRRDLLVRIGLTSIVVLFAVVLVGYIVMSHDKKVAASGARAIRVTSSKLVTKDGSKDPKAVVSFYEDFLCPACGNFERGFGPTVSKLIDDGEIAADYYMTGFLSRPQNQQYSSRAANAAYCVADESIDAFRRFHTALYTKDIQPSETGTSFPDNAKLTELAREAGVVGKVRNASRTASTCRWWTGWSRRRAFTPPRRSGSTARTTSSGEAGRFRRQDQGDRRRRSRNRLGCDPTGAVTSTAAAKPDEPVEDSNRHASACRRPAHGGFCSPAWPA